jgi:hypothetical protein
MLRTRTVDPREKGLTHHNTVRATEPGYVHGTNPAQHITSFGRCRLASQVPDLLVIVEVHHSSLQS